MGKGKKIAYDVANKTLKKISKATKPKAGRPKLYTEGEKKELKSLRDKRRYREKKLTDIKSQIDDYGKWTLKDMRANILDDDLAKELYYEGYFEPDVYDDYENKDIREWMAEKGDTEGLWDRVMEEYNSNIDDPNAKVGGMTDEEMLVRNLATSYEQELAEIDRTIKSIENKGLDRKKQHKEMVEALKAAHKLRMDTGYALLEAIDTYSNLGVDITQKLSKPEQAAVNMLKEQLAKQVVSIIPEGDTFMRNAVATGIMSSNPLEGVRTAMKGMVVKKAIMKYGNDAGDIADSMVDLATGKGSFKALGFNMLHGLMNKGGFNKETLVEKANELASLEHKNEVHKAAQFGSDVLFDIAKDVVMSGGNIYLAAGVIAKDLLFDTGKALVTELASPGDKKVKKESAKEKREREKRDEEQRKKIADAIANGKEEELLAKFMQ